MKKLTCLLILLLMFSTVCAAANLKQQLDKHADKMAHFFAGGFVAGLSYTHGAAPTSMLLNTTIVAAAREAFDYKFADNWDNWDLIVTILGGVAMVVL